MSILPWLIAAAGQQQGTPAPTPCDGTPMDVVTNGTVKGWYSAFEDTFSDGATITTITDQSSYGKNLTGAGSARPTYDTDVGDGVPAFVFDGSDDVVKASTASDWQFLNDGAHCFVVSMTLLDSSADGRSTIIDTGGLSASDRGVVLYADNRSANSGPIGIAARCTKAAGGSTDIYNLQGTVPGVTPEGSRQVVTVWCTASEAVIRINGRQNILPTDATLTAFSASAPTGALAIGGRTSGTLLPVDAYIHEAVFVDGELTQAEVEALEDQLACRANVLNFDTQTTVAVETGSGTGDWNGLGGGCKMSNGDILAVYRKSSGHSTGSGDIAIRISTDDGATWGSETTILDGATVGYDLRDAAAVALTNGDTAVTYSKRDTEGTGDSIVDGCSVVFSTDDGATWGTPVDLNDAFTGFSRCAAPLLELANGDLLWPIYGNSSVTGDDDPVRFCKVYKSTDDGATWSYLSDIGAYSDGLGLNEPNLVLASNGDVIAFIREGSNLRRAVSTDSGATWTAHSIVATGQDGSPRASYITGGHLLMPVREEQSGDQYDCLAVSEDNGATWKLDTRLGTLTTSTWTAFAYAQVIEIDSSTVLIVWSHDNNAGSGTAGSVRATTYTRR